MPRHASPITKYNIMQEKRRKGRVVEGGVDWVLGKHTLKPRLSTRHKRKWYRDFPHDDGYNIVVVIVDDDDGALGWRGNKGGEGGGEAVQCRCWNMHYSYGNGPLNYPSYRSSYSFNATASVDVKMMTGIFTLVSVSILYLRGILDLCSIWKIKLWYEKI